MPTLENTEQVIALYWEGDRSDVRKQYEELFGTRDTASGDDQAEKAVNQTEGKTIELTDDPEVDFKNLVEAFPLSESIKCEIRNSWTFLQERERPAAFDHLICVHNPQWSVYYVIEGLMNFFGPWVATHLIHAFYPQYAFPIDTKYRYDKFRSVLQILGIHYEDQKDLMPYEIALNVRDAVEQFQKQHNLEYWQMWALVYDLGPRLLPEPEPYPIDPPPSIWLTAAGRENFENVDRHTSNDQDTWTINPKVRRGDIVLMYCLAPRSAIVSVYRCACEAFRDPLSAYLLWGDTWTEITDKLEIPWLPLKEIRVDPVLAEWHMVKVKFQGLLRHQVSDEIWRRIKEVVADKDIEAGRMLEELAQAAEGMRAIKGANKARSEQEFEDEMILPLLENLGWDRGRTLHRQHEMDLKVGSGRPHRVRADIVGFRDALGSEALLVIECKRSIRSDKELRDAVEQAESYAGKLRCTRFAVVAPEGLWVYTLNFPGQSDQLIHLPVDGQISAAMVEKLKPLIGFASL